MCRIIGRELAEPVPDVSGLESVKYIIFDGKYLFGSKSCLLMVFDAQTRRPVAGRIAAREPKPQILPFLAEIKTAGLNPFGVTTDGNQGAVAAFKAIWPEIIAQRCLFRIERQSLSWCRMRPRYLPALELKNIVYGLTLIKSREQADSFTKTFSDLKDKHENELSSYDTNHVVQSDILKAYAVVNNALENMFRYIDNPQIAQTTNNVESYFKQIQNIKGFRHNGLTKTHLTQLINWKIHYDTKPKNQSPKHKKSSPKNNT